MLDAIIIGAGVSGCAIARELSRCQGEILVIDRAEDVCCGTSKANSAIVHAGYDAAHGTLMARLNVEGSRRMPALARELDVPYRQCGSLVVCLDPSGLPRLESLLENGRANGVEGLRIIQQEELAAMEPHIADQAVAALFAPTGGIVCPFELTFGLAENAAHNGVRFQFDTAVTGLAPIQGGWRLETSQGPLESRLVVNAAGVHADELHNLADPDHPMQIIPRRGDYVLLDRTAGGYVNHTIFQLPGPGGKGVLVTPTVHGNLLVGPTAIDQEDKDSTATTAQGLDQLRAKASLAVKDIPLDQVITSFAGLRAHEPRHEFFIGEVVPGFVDCAAIESPGLSSAPAIGAMAAEIAARSLHLSQKHDFDPIRTAIPNPRQLSWEQRAALVREHPAYGRIICRCEGISEGEILEAIHRIPGARSLDGVKRRTRAGMGRCQGGFCSPRVMELLARELGQPLSAITKAGGDSWLIAGPTKDAL